MKVSIIGGGIGSLATANALLKHGFENAYELAECLACAPNVETALKDYDQRRIPRTEAIYARRANQCDRSYKLESDTTFRKIMQPSQMNQDQFQDWLYGYNPSEKH